MKIKCNCGEKYDERKFRIHTELFRPLKPEHDKSTHFAVAVIIRGKELSIEEFKLKMELKKCGRN